MQQIASAYRKSAFISLPTRSWLEAERTVQPPHQWQERLVLARQERRQRRTGHLLVGQCASTRERLESQPLCGGVIVGIAARHPLQRALVIKPTEPARNRARHSIESFRILGNCVAQLLELRPRRHPKAGAECG